MGLFGSSKKKDNYKEPDYDPLNIKITDLRPGFMVDYKVKTWEVSESFEYDLSNKLSRRFKLHAGDESMYIYLSGENKLYIIKEIPIQEIESDLKDKILKQGLVSDNLNVNDIFYKVSENVDGHVRDMNLKYKDWSKVFFWNYFSNDTKNILFIVQFGMNQLNAYIGELSDEYEFINILPRNI